MEIVKLCRLCLNIVDDDGVELVENIYQILEDIFMKVNLGISDDPIICNDCATNLQDFFDYKWKCLGTENVIQTFKDISEFSTLNLREVYLNENKDDIFDISEDQKICRFCMKITKYEFTQLHDTKANIHIISMLQKHIPELNLNITEELIACKSCFDSLQNFHGFITKCTDVEQKIANYFDSQGTDVNGHIQLDKVAELAYGDITRKDTYKCEKEGSQCVKIKGDNSLEEDVVDMSIKTEEIDLKMEVTGSDSQDSGAVPQPEIPMFSCQKCSFKTKYRRSLKLHNLSHQNPTEVTMYECDICSYKTKFKLDLKRHSLIHKYPSEVQRFSCQLCTYRAKLQSDIKLHMLNHERLQNPNIKVFKCDICSYRAKYKWHLNEHLLVHKSPSEVTMYKCTECTFATKYKLSLQKHSILHKNPDEVTMFKCDSCSYESMRQGNLKRHLMKHKSPSEITLLECDKCSYKGKQKDHLKKHMIVHKNPSKLPIYKCKHCAYESKYKQTLKRHMLTHFVGRIGQ